MARSGIPFDRKKNYNNIKITLVTLFNLFSQKIIFIFCDKTLKRLFKRIDHDNKIGSYNNY